MDGLKLERYKKQIDEDFIVFPINKRLIQLEKSWIRNISHNIMSDKRYFLHRDRKRLRKKLFNYLLKYLNKKKKEADPRGIK